MTMSLLLEYFDNLLITPENAEQLNSVILQLAMQGKLVLQDPKDEPASKLLKRIPKELKVNLLPVKEDEKPYEISDSWEWVRLEEIAEILMGQSPPGTSYNDSGEGVPLINGPVEFGDGPFAKTKKTKFTTLPTKMCKEGDLLVCVRGSTTGRTNISGFEACIGRGVAAIRSKFGYQEYLNYFMLYYRDSFYKLGTGSTFPSVSSDKIQTILFPLPPLAEQKRIVARVEELFAQTRALAKELAHSQIELDGLNQSALSHLLASKTPEEFNQHWDFIAENFDLLFQSPEHIAPLRQSILELAVQGKLTRREAGDETAQELLKQIKAEKDKTGKKSSLSQISEGEAPFDLPEGWEWVRLGELVTKIGAGSTPKGGKEVYDTEGTKFIRSQNVYNDGLRLDDVVYISDSINEKMSGTIVKAKDILLNITGASIARCALVPDDFDSANVNQHVMIIRLIEPEIRKFIHICMISPYIYNLIMSVQVGMSREGLSIGKLEKFVLPFPPLAEQERIVKRVEQLLSLCDALEGRLQSAEEERGRLVESVLAGVGGQYGE